MEQPKEYPMGAIIPIIRSGLKTAGLGESLIQYYKEDDFEYLMINDECQINWNEWEEEIEFPLDGSKRKVKREGWEFWLWIETMGSFYEPPDCYEKLVSQGTLTDCILAIAKHYHDIMIENAWYDISYQMETLEMKQEDG